MKQEICMHTALILHVLSQDLQQTATRWISLVARCWKTLRTARLETYIRVLFSAFWICTLLAFFGFFEFCGWCGNASWKAATGQVTANNRAAALEATWCVRLVCRHHQFLVSDTSDLSAEVQELEKEISILFAELDALSHESDTLLQEAEAVLVKADSILTQLRNEAYIPEPLASIVRFRRKIWEKKPPPPIVWTEQVKLIVSNPDAARDRLTHNTRLRHYLLQREGMQPETSSN